MISLYLLGPLFWERALPTKGFTLHFTTTDIDHPALPNGQTPTIMQPPSPITPQLMWRELS